MRPCIAVKSCLVCLILFVLLCSLFTIFTGYVHKFWVVSYHAILTWILLLIFLSSRCKLQLYLVPLMIDVLRISWIHKKKNVKKYEIVSVLPVLFCEKKEIWFPPSGHSMKILSQKKIHAFSCVFRKKFTVWRIFFVNKFSWEDHLRKSYHWGITW